MGLEPDLDAGTLIRNPEFVDASEWRLGVGWSIAGGKASYVRGVGPAGNLLQEDVGGVLDYWYNVKFKLSNTNFTEPDGGLQIIFNNALFPTIFRTDGEHQATFPGGVIDEQFLLITVNETVGDTADVEFVNLFPMVLYPQNELGFNIPDVQKTEVYTVGPNRISQTLASRNGKTNIGILYDL